jgi:hypothetical protein
MERTEVKKALSEEKAVGETFWARIPWGEGRGGGGREREEGEGEGGERAAGRGGGGPGGWGERGEGEGGRGRRGERGGRGGAGGGAHVRACVRARARRLTCPLLPKTPTNSQ